MRYHETLYSEWGQNFEQGQTLFEAETGHQHLIIFDNPRFGRVMALDGVIQTTEADEFVYHEMMVHVPMNTHLNPKHILIIGGGDGGILREVLKHNLVESVTQVEIDRAVIDLCVEYFPNGNLASRTSKYLIALLKSSKLRNSFINSILFKCTFSVIFFAVSSLGITYMTSPA